MNCLRLVSRAAGLSTHRPLLPKQNSVSNYTRLFRRDAREEVIGRTTGKRRTAKEILLSPTTGKPFEVGRLAVAGGAALGLGALCYYGAGLAKQESALDRALVWPQYVKDRIRSTYMYFGGGLVFTAATAAAVLRSPVLMNYASRNSLTALLVSMGAMIGTSMIAQSLPYKEGIGAKQIAWATHAAVIGTVIAPIALLGGALMLRAAVYTAGVVGGLSAVAASAPSEKFLNYGGPLAIGLGVVFAASLGSMFLPPTTALGAGLYSISMYGGLLLFSAFLLYDTQKVIHKAERHPPIGPPFDPINASLGIYMDTINIFIRIAMILAGQNSKKR